MHRVAATSLVLLLAACGEPTLGEAEVLGDEAMASLAPSGSLTMRKTEGYCSDNKDNDYDGRTDLADTDCTYSGSVGTLGFGGTVYEGTDIHPGYSVAMTLDGSLVTVSGGDAKVTIRSGRTTLATLYLDSDPTYVGIGQAAAGTISRTNYAEVWVVTEGGGVGYALGQVRGNWVLSDPPAEVGTPEVPVISDPSCPLGC